MTERIQNFLMKNGTDPSCIMYIVRSGRKTALNLSDGRTIETYAALKEVIASLPASEFIHVNKSAVVNKRHVVRIEKGQYIMTDGCVIKGRVRTPGEHNRNRIIIDELRQNQSAMGDMLPINEKYHALQDIPIGFMVLEVVYKEGFGMDLMTRYLNKEMDRILGHTEPAIDQPLHVAAPDLDRKTLIKMADVAVNGGVKNMVDYNDDANKCLYIRCFQPSENLCGCLVIDAPNMKV